jgi:hypothetical protein
MINDNDCIKRRSKAVCIPECLGSKGELIKSCFECDIYVRKDTNIRI